MRRSRTFETLSELSSKGMGSLCDECESDAQCSAGLKCTGNLCMIPGYRYACQPCLGGTIKHMWDEYPYEVTQCYQKPLTEDMKTDPRYEQKDYYCECIPGGTLKTGAAFRFLFDMPTKHRPRTIYTNEALRHFSELPNFVCDGYWTFDPRDQWEPLTATCNRAEA